MGNYFSYQQYEFNGKPVYKLGMEEADAASHVCCKYCHHDPLQIHLPLAGTRTLQRAVKIVYRRGI